MKPLVVILVAALALAVGADGNARPVRHRPVRAAIHKAHTARHRARVRVRRTSAPRPRYSDELALSPTLLRQLQHNLTDGGYYHGRIDGELTRSTRRALVDFQREYHLRDCGHLDRATADALLGRDAVGASIVASKK